MGLASIPWTSVNDYAKAFDFDEEQTEDLFFYIRKMDAAHLKRLDSKNKTDGKKPSRLGKRSK